MSVQDEFVRWLEDAGRMPRRAFLRSGASLVALGATAPAFLAHTVFAETRGRRRKAFAADERILVVIQLAGGNDGLNTVIPVDHDVYQRVRPRLAIRRADALRLDDDFCLHGDADGLKELYDAGALAIVHGVGYPNPNRSHFKSTDIWQSAAPNLRQTDGWLGRYFDNTCRGEPECDPARAIALTSETPLALRGERFLPLAFERPENLAWQSAVRGYRVGQVISELNQPLPNDPPQPQSALEYLRHVALQARINAQDIREAAGTRHSPVDFPRTDLGRSLETVSRLIGGGLRTRVYYVSLTGFDTHARQAADHARLLVQLGEALMAFFRALKAQGDLERVLVMTFSEFGRRVAENASAGTDHGTAAPMFLAGAQVRGGLHGTAPDLDNLDASGDLRFTTDFRSVYAAVLKDWLGSQPERTLGDEIKPMELIARR